MTSFLRLLFGDDAPGSLVLFVRQGGRAYWLPAHDLAAAGRLAERLATTCDVYFGIAPQDKTAAFAKWRTDNPDTRGEPTTRGYSETAVALPGLWQDVDILSPAHKDTRLPPTKEAARALIAEFPLRPTVVIDSGHGVQPWWLFRELWVFEGEAERHKAQTLARRFLATMQERASAHGWVIDPTSDLARVLRLPKTWNRKLEPVPVRVIEYNEHCRYNPIDVAEYLIDTARTEDNHRDTATPRQAIPADLIRVQEALRYVPADNYVPWLSVGMALHSTGRDEAFTLWCGWSRTCPEKFDADVCHKKWQSFSAERDNAITVATIFQLAKEHGWKPSRNGTRTAEVPPAPKWSDTAAAAGGTTTGDSLPTIQVNNRPLRDIASDALRALRQRNSSSPFLFVRSGALARIVTDERHRPIIETVNEPALRGHLTRSAEFIRVTAKEDKKTGEGKFINTHVPPPKEVVQDVLSLADKPFPALVGITECPVLRPDGTILTIPGYDPATRLYFRPATGLKVMKVPEHPTEADARTARDFLLQELLADFPFAEGADLANMVACLLTPIVRPTISGTVPLCLLDKPGPGSGATLLSDVVATVATGEHAVKELAPESGRQSEEEWRKKITALLLAGVPVIVWDNIENSIASSALSAALTTTAWGDRILGESRTVRLANRATWIATANNVSLRGDLARRCYRVRLDPQQERPWTREGFRHPDLLTYCLTHRGELLSTFLTMARAWYAAGKPQPEAKIPKLGGFEQWTSLVGGILAYAGIYEFLENQESLYALVDDEGPEWRGFLEAWYQTIGERSVTVRYLAGVLSGTPAENPLLESLPESVGWDETKLQTSRDRLGKALKKRAFRIYGAYRLERGTGDAHNKVASWTVRGLRGLRG